MLEEIDWCRREIGIKYFNIYIEDWDSTELELEKKKIVQIRYHIGRHQDETIG